MLSCKNLLRDHCCLNFFHFFFCFPPPPLPLLGVALALGAADWAGEAVGKRNSPGREEEEKGKKPLVWEICNMVFGDEAKTIKFRRKH